MTGTNHQAICDVAALVAEQCGVVLYHMEATAVSARIEIDSPTGVSHDICSTFLRSFAQEAESRGLLPRGYTLEVSSPGIERNLYQPRDFAAAMERRVKVWTRTGVTEGTISAVDDTGFLLRRRTNEGEQHQRIEFSTVTTARLVVSDAELFGRRMTNELSNGRRRRQTPVTSRQAGSPTDRSLSRTTLPAKGVPCE